MLKELLEKKEVTAKEFKIISKDKVISRIDYKGRAILENGDSGHLYWVYVEDKMHIINVQETDYKITDGKVKINCSSNNSIQILQEFLNKYYAVDKRITIISTDNPRFKATIHSGVIVIFNKETWKYMTIAELTQDVMTSILPDLHKKYKRHAYDIKLRDTHSIKEIRFLGFKKGYKEILIKEGYKPDICGDYVEWQKGDYIRLGYTDLRHNDKKGGILCYLHESLDKNFLEKLFNFDEDENNGFINTIEDLKVING